MVFDQWAHALLDRGISDGVLDEAEFGAYFASDGLPTEVSLIRSWAIAAVLRRLSRE